MNPCNTYHPSDRYFHMPQVLTGRILFNFDCRYNAGRLEQQRIAEELASLL